MIVTRSDLSDGYKAVQSTHAAINFTFEHPSRAGPWFKDSNYLVQLEIENEGQLENLITNCERLQIVYTIFREPDIGNQITAIAIEPSLKTQKLVAKLPLMFKSKTNEIKYNNTCNQSKTCQPHSENSLQETSERDIRSRQNLNVRPNFWSKLRNALGIKCIQKQKEG